MDNKKELFYFVLAILFLLFFALFIINTILFILGLGIIVNTSSYTLFIYTLFPKMISMKLVITFFSCCVSKELKLANFALSLPSIIVALFLKLSMNIEKKKGYVA
jgi:hypothetical protein